MSTFTAEEENFIMKNKLIKSVTFHFCVCFLFWCWLSVRTELLFISKSASLSKGLKERQISKQNPASRPIQAKISNFCTRKPNVMHFATIWQFQLFWNRFFSRCNLEMKKKLDKQLTLYITTACNPLRGRLPPCPAIIGQFCLASSSGACTYDDCLGPVRSFLSAM